MTAAFHFCQADRQITLHVFTFHSSLFFASSFSIHSIRFSPETGLERKASACSTLASFLSSALRMIIGRLASFWLLLTKRQNSWPLRFGIIDYVTPTST